jgi:dethiobiotin synthetase
MNYFITGTDTGAGKTAAASILLSKVFKNHYYLKPVQTGFPADNDTETVRNFLIKFNNESAASRILEHRLTFTKPWSPHLASEAENFIINTESLADEIILASIDHHVVLEGAGGLLVPLNRQHSWIDFLNILLSKNYKFKVIIAARTGIGTINHTLLTVNELLRNHIPIEGLFFCGPSDGEPYEDNIKYLSDRTSLPVLGIFDSENRDRQLYNVSTAINR